MDATGHACAPCIIALQSVVDGSPPRRCTRYCRCKAKRSLAVRNFSVAARNTDSPICTMAVCRGYCSQKDCDRCGYWRGQRFGHRGSLFSSGNGYGADRVAEDFTPHRSPVSQSTGTSYLCSQANWQVAGVEKGQRGGDWRDISFLHHRCDIQVAENVQEELTANEECATSELRRPALRPASHTILGARSAIASSNGIREHNTVRIDRPPF